MSKYNFDGLFIYDLANNHQGNLEHGKNIIKEIAKVSNAENVKGAFKFQFRHLDTFFHPDYRDSEVSKHIPRFLSTALSDEQFAELTDEVRKNNLITIATPFDEESVDLINKLNIEIVKVGSCSANDWPLLEEISKAGKPVICSTGGLNIRQIDNIVDSFERRNVEFALMHCIPLYPTNSEDLQLNQIETMCSRYPHITIGFSTHEHPDNMSAIKIAYAKGVRIFERHVGLVTSEISLNEYSSQPSQIKSWLKAYKEAVVSCGALNRPPAKQDIISSLQSLKRGVFVNKPISKGSIIKRNDVFFAMPCLDNMLDTNKWFEGMIADKDYKAKEPLANSLALQKHTTIREEIIKEVIQQTKGMLNDAMISINKVSTIELSHHYGIERFREYGAVIVNCINRSYCKKLIIQLPAQKHPYHYHKNKEETFQILYGEFVVEKDGNSTKMVPGDIMQINSEEWHKFETLKGGIFEEVSTTHYDNDSLYKDDNISLIPREQRKTILINVGNNVFLYKERNGNN